MSKQLKNINVDNRKAKFEYEFIEEFTAGIKLTATELKSIINGEVSIDDAYCFISDKGIFIRNMYVKEYEFAHGVDQNHIPKADRTLLLNKSELNSLRRNLINKGLTIIPIKLFRNNRGLIKINIALCKGKKLFDKRETIKNRDLDKKLRRSLED